MNKALWEILALLVYVYSPVSFFKKIIFKIITCSSLRNTQRSYKKASYWKFKKTPGRVGNNWLNKSKAGVLFPHLEEEKKKANKFFLKEEDQKGDWREIKSSQGDRTGESFPNNMWINKYLLGFF